MFFWSIIVGIFTGFSVGVGASRMYHSPTKQGLGAFRTMGEINACNGDPVSHVAFGLGFFFNAAASALGAGALTQDVAQRVLPNWGIALASTFNRKKDNFQILRSPTYVGIAAAIVGAVTLPLILALYNIIPTQLSVVASKVLSDAASVLINPVMPIIFLIASMDAGKKTGVMSLIFGALFQISTGNALPGIILGILVGSSWAHSGLKAPSFWVLFILIIGVWILITYFRFLPGYNALTWDKIIHFEPTKEQIHKLVNTFRNLVDSNFDVSLLTYSGILSEV